MQTRRSGKGSAGRPRWWDTRWALPGLSVALGLGMLAVSWAGGRPGRGVAMLAIMAGVAAVLLFGGRSETIRGMRGDGRDERWTMIDLRATAAVGVVVVIAILAGAFVEIARGRNGSPYVELAALAGIAYLVTFFVARRRY